MMKILSYKTVCSVQLNKVKILILVSINILNMVMDLMKKELFYSLIVDSVTMQ